MPWGNPYLSACVCSHLLSKNRIIWESAALDADHLCNRLVTAQLQVVRRKKIVMKSPFCHLWEPGVPLAYVPQMHMGIDDEPLIEGHSAYFWLSLPKEKAASISPKSRRAISK